MKFKKSALLLFILCIGISVYAVIDFTVPKIKVYYQHPPRCNIEITNVVSRYHINNLLKGLSTEKIPTRFILGTGFSITQKSINTEKTYCFYGDHVDVTTMSTKVTTETFKIEKSYYKIFDNLIRKEIKERNIKMP